MKRSPVTPEMLTDWLNEATVTTLDGDGDEFVIEFSDGRTILLVATEMLAS